MKTFVPFLCASVALMQFPVYGAGDGPRTHLLLRLEHSVSIRTAKPGNFVHFRTASPVAGIPSGSYAVGVITLVKRAALFHKDARLEIDLVSITRPDGTVVQVSGPASSVEPPPGRDPGTHSRILLLAPLSGSRCRRRHGPAYRNRDRSRRGAACAARRARA